MDAVMPTEMPSEKLADQKQTIHESGAKELLSKKVIDLLGIPSRFLSTRVQEVWPNHYRVNVYVGQLGGLVKVAHSFFVTTDSQANIIQSSPQIKRHY
jgi:hypothetical protein